jgi:hypothetical protein
MTVSVQEIWCLFEDSQQSRIQNRVQSNGPAADGWNAFGRQVPKDACPHFSPGSRFAAHLAAPDPEPAADKFPTAFCLEGVVYEYLQVTAPRGNNQPRTYLLNQSIVRCQARSAAALL